MDDERGFTLIEVVTTCLIIGILLGMVLPTMLAARHRAEDRAAQVDLRNAVASARIWFTDRRSYSGFTAGEDGTAEYLQPSLTWLSPGDPGGAEGIPILVATGHDLLLVRRSDSGLHFCISDGGDEPGFHRGKALDFEDVDTLAECAGGW
jgi:prepilin-type N-terminal cleavage/methylation domain-containing protein